MNLRWLPGILLIPLFLYAPATALRADDVRVQGSVLCTDARDTASEAPAPYIIVYAAGLDQYPTYTLDNGYFALNLSSTKTVDRVLTIQFFDDRSLVSTSSIYVGAEKLKRIKGQWVVQFPTTHLKRTCDSIRAYSDLLDTASMRGFVERQRPETDTTARASRLTPSTRLLGGAAAALGALALLTADRGDDSGVPYPPDSVLIDTVPVMDISEFSLAGADLRPFLLTGGNSDIGFSFSPSRDPADAALWNAAVISLQRSGAIRIRSDFREYVGLEAVRSFGSRWGAGLSVSTLQQDREHAFTEAGGKEFRDTLSSSDWMIRVNLAFGAGRIGAFGITPFYNTRKWETADSARRMISFAGSLSTSSYRALNREHASERINADLSYARTIGDYLQLGVTILNVFGQTDTQMKESPYAGSTLGVGAAYRRSRVNIGADFLASDEKLDAGLGLSVVPIAHAKLAGGYLTYLETASLVAMYKWISYTYTHSLEFGSTHLLGLQVRW